MVYFIPCLYSGLPVLCPTLRAWRLSVTGYVAVFEPTPGRGGRQWLESLPRHSAGVGIPLHWPEGAERALLTPNQKKLWYSVNGLPSVDFHPALAA